jgi:nitroreductase
MHDFIYKRRSIRKYKPDPVPDELVTETLKAAMAAPSANNARPWAFVVVRDPETRRALSNVHQYARMAADAPVVIVVLGDRGNRWMQQDCAAATENLLLAAANLGLGAVWVGLREERDAPVRELLGVPGKYRAFCLVPVGYPAEEKEPRTQYDEARVHRGRW